MSSLMRVVLVSTGVVTIPPQAGGAVESYVWDLAQMLFNQGVSVSIVSNSHRNLIPKKLQAIDFVPTPSPIDRFPLRPEASAIAHLAGGFGVTVATRVFLSRVEKGLTNNGLVLHLNEEVSGLALSHLTRGVPKVLTLHNPPISLSPTDIGRRERLFRGAGSLMTLRFTLPHIDRVIALSTPLARFLETNWGVDSNRIDVLPLPLDTGVFTPSTEGFGKRSGLLYVGRLEGRKNPRMLIDCLAGCPDSVRLTIVGKGPLESQIRAEARRRGVIHRLFLESEVSLARLINLYQSSLALVLPSSLEIYPRVVIEAAACGLPVVLPSCQIYEDFVSAGFVSTHVLGDTKSLREAVLRTLESDARWTTMSQAGRSFAMEQLGYQAYGRKLLQVYQKVTA